MTLRKKAFENIVGKGENASNQHFLLFPQCFLPFLCQSSVFESHLFCRQQLLSFWTSRKFCRLVKELRGNACFFFQTDIWGLGCCAYEMLTLKRAFEGKALWTLIREIRNGKVGLILKGKVFCHANFSSVTLQQLSNILFYCINTTRTLSSLQCTLHLLSWQNCLTLYQTTILDWSKLKAFADEKMHLNQKVKFGLARIENIVGKRDSAGYQHFLLFPQCFQKTSFSGSLKVGIVW